MVEAKGMLIVGVIAVLSFLVISSVMPTTASGANDTYTAIDGTNFADARTSWQNSFNWLALGIGLLILIGLVAYGIKGF